MANYCDNFIRITGDKDQLKELYKDLVLDPESGSDSGCGIYANLRNKYQKEPGDDARWFDMHVTFDNEEEIVISGSSAWCPCLEIFTVISEKFTGLHIRYDYSEMGCDFSGWAEIEDGGCDDNCFEYWKGMVIREGEEEALCMVIENELSCYESEEELIGSDMYLTFSEESQAEILESYRV